MPKSGLPGSSDKRRKDRGVEFGHELSSAAGADAQEVVVWLVPQRFVLQTSYSLFHLCCQERVVLVTGPEEKIELSLLERDQYYLPKVFWLHDAMLCCVCKEADCDLCAVLQRTVNVLLEHKKYLDSVAMGNLPAELTAAAVREVITNAKPMLAELCADKSARRAAKQALVDKHKDSRGVTKQHSQN